MAKVSLFCSRKLSRLSHSGQTRGRRPRFQNFSCPVEQIDREMRGAPLTGLPKTGASARCGRRIHFIRPAAVSARVMTLPTSMPRRRGGCGGGSAGRATVVSGHNT